MSCFYRAWEPCFRRTPFLALLILLITLRWKDFHKVLLTERSLTSKPAIRLAELMLILLLVTLWTLFFGQGAPSVYLAMEICASSLVLVVYGTLLAINPAKWKIMLPYASLYALGPVSSLFMLDVFGVPMAAFSSYLAAGITSAIGIHVAWQDVSFGFVSATGEPISAVVTSACSAIYSIGM
jgi:hypothetical protein